jgi:DNA repair protein RadC
VITCDELLACLHTNSLKPAHVLHMAQCHWPAAVCPTPKVAKAFEKELRAWPGLGKADATRLQSSVFVGRGNKYVDEDQSKSARAKGSVCPVLMKLVLSI